YGLSWTGDQSVHPDIWQTINDGSIAQNNILENNYIHDTGDTQVGNIETNPAGTNVSNWTFRNNLFANAGTLYSSGGYFKFYNNTYYRTGANNQATVLLYNGTGYGDASGTEFKNNIYIQDPTQGTFFASMGNPTYTHDYNMVANTDFTPRSDFSEPHGVNGGNPQFTSVFSNCTINVCDFHIGFSSAAKDKGTTISGYSNDYTGNSRIAPWDIGAYEFGSGSALTPTALSAPVHLRIVTP
ncbi:MAG: choice-of-anchor Q domain-containing protein, partial [Mucilaginibacter sp.]